MITVYSDGGKKEGVTYGSFKLVSETGKEIYRNSFVIGFGTSIQAEYETLATAVEYCLVNGYNEVIFNIDSLLVQKQISGEYRCNYDHLKQARNRIRKLLKQFKKYEINHISGKEMKLKKNLGH